MIVVVIGIVLFFFVCVGIWLGMDTTGMDLYWEGREDMNDKELKDVKMTQPLGRTVAVVGHGRPMVSNFFERITELEAENAHLRKILEEIGRVGILPGDTIYQVLGTELTDYKVASVHPKIDTIIKLEEVPGRRYSLIEFSAEGHLGVDIFTKLEEARKVQMDNANCLY